MPKIFNTSSQAQPLCCLKVFSIHLFTHEYSVKITPLLFLFWTYYNTRCLRQSHLLCVTCLGVSIDQELTFADHIRSLECRCFFWIRQLRSVRRTLTSDTIIALVNALIISRLDYCNNILVGVYDIHLRQLQGVLNAAARLIARRRKFDSISSTIRRDVLHWLPIRQRVNFKLSVLTFNCIRNLAPSCLMNMCQPVQATFIDAICVLLCMATSSFHRRRQSVTVHAALLSLGRQREMRYLHHYAMTNSPPCQFGASWRLNYTLEHIIYTSTLVTVFTVRVGEHNFIVLTYLLSGSTVTLH